MHEAGTAFYCSSQSILVFYCSHYSDRQKYRGRLTVNTRTRLDCLQPSLGSLRSRETSERRILQNYIIVEFFGIESYLLVSMYAKQLQAPPEETVTLSCLQENTERKAHLCSSDENDLSVKFLIMMFACLSSREDTYSAAARKTGWLRKSFNSPYRYQRQTHCK